MLSDEEKKAIVELNHFSNMTAYWKQEEYTNSEIDNYIKLVLNLIEKQSKEIEELKTINQMQKYRIEVIDERELISKDKIKAKIEEVDIQLQKLKDGLTGRKTNFVNKNMLFAQKKVLQSLLEKE